MLHLKCLVFITSFKHFAFITVRFKTFDKRFPKFAMSLAMSLHSRQSFHELQNEVVNFIPNFLWKLRSSSRAKFASFGVVGLVI